jgi:hypothetical protein
VRDAPYYEAAFLARLAHRMNVLGYATEQHKDSFRLVRIDKRLADKFCGRTKEIEAKIAKLEAEGQTLSAKEKARIGEKTRQKKSQSKLTKEELKKVWWERPDSRDVDALVRVANHTESPGT